MAFVRGLWEVLRRGCVRPNSRLPDDCMNVDAAETSDPAPPRVAPLASTPAVRGIRT
jgi:hypothetical protein